MSRQHRKTNAQRRADRAERARHARREQRRIRDAAIAEQLAQLGPAMVTFREQFAALGVAASETSRLLSENLHGLRDRLLRAGLDGQR